MPTTQSSSSSRGADARPASRLEWIRLAALRAHPRNANEMSADRRDKLMANIRRQGGEYPPLIVRPHPRGDDAYEILDGHQRRAVLDALGEVQALCYVWPCDDKTALLLLATLNRLEGEDVPYRRAALLDELAQLIPPADLAALLPEDAALIADTIALLDLDAEALAADLAAAEAAAQDGDEVLSFVLSPDDAEIVRAAVDAEAASLRGRNRRGRAIARICAAYEGGEG